jgi:hypothetical protein
MTLLLLILLLLLPATAHATDPAPFPETRYVPIPDGYGGVRSYGTTSGGGYDAYDAHMIGAAMQAQMDRDAEARKPRYVSPPLDVPYPYQLPAPPPFCYRCDEQR